MVRDINGRRRCDHYEGSVRCNMHAEVDADGFHRCHEHALGVARPAPTRSGCLGCGIAKANPGIIVCSVHQRGPAPARRYALERQKALFEGDHVDKNAANAIANYTQDPLCLKASLAPFDLEPHEAEHVANRADLAMRAYAASMLRWLASSHPETLQARFELRARKLEEPDQ